MNSEIHRSLELALAEDIGSGDITSKICVPEDAMASGSFIARERLVLAGAHMLPLIYSKAPEKVVSGIRTKLAEYRAQLAKIEAELESL